MTPLVNIAVQAARAAGDTMIRSMNRLHTIQVQSKGRNDFVTEIDRFIEKQVIEEIRKAHPQHRFLGEEFGASGNDEAEIEWIIDPIDGTTNYLHGFPVFCVSIAARKNNKLEAGVIYDPLRQEIFSASRGNGAQLEGKRIRVTAPKGLEGGLIGTGFPFKGDAEQLDRYLKGFRSISLQASDIRRAGSAALDLAYVASGRLDGFWEYGLKLWDIAAGELIVREAGGLVCDVNGQETHAETGNIVAGSPKVLRDLLRCLQPYLNDEDTDKSDGESA